MPYKNLAAYRVAEEKEPSITMKTHWVFADDLDHFDRGRSGAHIDQFGGCDVLRFEGEDGKDCIPVWLTAPTFDGSVRVEVEVASTP